MEEVLYQKKKQENQELLILFRKLEELEDTCWMKLFRFEKSQYFVQFQKKYSVPNIINLRLDDFIYLLLLVIQELIFGLLPIDGNSYFTTPYRQSLALFFLTSFVVLISPHWFRWVALAVICLGYPVLIFTTFNGYFSIMPVDTSTLMINYLGYLTLTPILVLLLLIYPIKQYIRNLAGSLYSYIYALSLTLILYLWPLYSFIQSNASLSFAFILSNQPLVISFIIIAVSGFYFFIHHSLFEMKLDKIKSLLLEDFTEGQIIQALEETQEEHQQAENFIQKNFNLFVRSMSFIIYAITIGSQIFLYITLTNNISKISSLGPMMGYIIVFLLLGAFFMVIPMSRQIFIPFISILSTLTPLLSLVYYNSSTDFQMYTIISLSFPFFALFWSLVKIISPKKPIFRIILLIGLYIIVYLPAIGLAMNQFEAFTQDSSTISILKIFFYSIFVVSFTLLLVGFIIWQIVKKRKDVPNEEQKQRVPVDYSYHQQGNPEYQHYQINKLINMSNLSNLDMREPGYILCMIFFLVSQIMATHAVNELKTTFAGTTFYSSIINQVIYSQFYIALVFYLYTHTFLASNGDIGKYFFITYFILTSILFLIVGFVSNSGSTLFRILGGFSIIMALAVVALQAIKTFFKTNFGFLSSIIVSSLWLFIVFPYAILIPFISIHVDQTKFGTFIYGCILATVVLLIFLVGVLTLIFNMLIDKYQEQKKFKYLMQDVATLLEEEGVGSQDQELHILYESFLYRDKKYVFFLKRGYPLNLLKDPDDEITKLVTSEDYKLKRIPTKKEINQQKERKASCLWMCLTCFCGQDEEQITEKIKKAKKKMDKEQLQSLLPKSILPGLIMPQKNIVNVKNSKRKFMNHQKVFSSKSLILKDLHTGPRYLGDQYILLKTNKKADIAIEIWHNIFLFASNEDQGEPLIISNDFVLFLEASGITQFSKSQMDEIFNKFARKSWGSYAGMDLDDFALAVEHISQQIYEPLDVKITPEQRKFYLLIDKIYYNLSIYEEFNNFIFQKRKRKLVRQIVKSPFHNSYIRYKQFMDDNNAEKQDLIKRMKMHDKNKLIDEEEIVVVKISEKEEEEKKDNIQQKSCKKILFEKAKACQQCCRKEQSKQQIQKHLFVKPWILLAVDVVKIMQRKQIEWGSSQQDSKQHPFRLISNNILMAVFKLVDIYTYLSISIMNPQLKWLNSYSTSSNLYIDYTIQTYAAAAIVLISVPLGIRGIMLIFQDRLGLTQNRLPAAFPHPMFFFTFIYKLMILSLFNIITQTFLDTFNCNWTAASTPYILNDDTSVECFSDSHNRMVMIALLGIIIYYPLSSYAMPNFQFAEKSLDLKYRSSYLILYFQVNFALLSGKVLLSSSSSSTVQIIYNSINILALALLGVSVVGLQPCLITWFNYVELMVICVGLVVNIMGLVLYLTELWTVCAIVAGAGCLLVILGGIFLIRKKFFKRQVQAEVQEDNVHELEMMWFEKQKKEKKIIEFEGRGKNRRELEAIHGEIDNQGSSDDQTLPKKNNSKDLNML